MSKFIWVWNRPCDVAPVPTPKDITLGRFVRRNSIREIQYHSPLVSEVLVERPDGGVRFYVAGKPEALLSRVDQ